jgi:hypothetical protein
MQALFDYGARCAQSGQLWTTLDETMNTIAAAAPVSKQTPPLNQAVACPLRDIKLVAAGMR